MNNWNKPLGILVGMRPDVRTFQEDPSLPMSNKYIGIEIEAENMQFNIKDINEQLSYWEVKLDGSLRNYGAEFVSKKLRGKDIFLALYELNSCLQTNKIELDFSERTSLHIHADARFMTLDQLRSFITYYLIHEPLLFEYVGHNREDNNYCIPYYMNTQGVSNLSGLFKDIGEARNILAILNNAKKYEAMNIRSIQEKGSIEFRSHYGTSNSEIVLKWVRILLSIFKESKSTPYEQHISQFLNIPYKFIAEEFLNKHELGNNYNLKDCEKKALESIRNLLAHQTNVFSLEKELSLHWPRAKPLAKVQTQP